MDRATPPSGARHPDNAPGSAGGIVEVHYWASARSAAGVAAEAVPVEAPILLAGLVTELTARHPDSRLREVLHVCAVLRDGEQIGNRDPEAVEIRPGQTVEFLPPFAGG